MGVGMAFSMRRAPKRCLSLQVQARISHRRYLSSIPSITAGEPPPHLPSHVSRLAKFWLPIGSISAAEGEDGHAKLVRAGYLRQSHAGIFHMLPLGERVQKKLEGLIDKHMSQLGAAKVSLSSISSQALWQRTNRLDDYGKELFRFTDRKDVPYILAPTHEEEITTLVAKTIKHSNLPLRLYQIGRKYRDEIRPRRGMLRSREFVMKDLYTFDHSLQSALKTYEEARAAYNRLFDELKLPYLVAEASSGDIGGDLSHEYHLPSPIGEDTVISCTDCNYIANEELAAAQPVHLDDQSPTEGNNESSPTSAQVWRGISRDRKTLVNVWYPASFAADDINTYAIKSILPGLDSSLEDTLPLWQSTLKAARFRRGKPTQLLNIIDCRLGQHFENSLKDEPSQFPILPEQCPAESSKFDEKYITLSANGEPFNAIRIHDGDHCPRCTSGKLTLRKAIELGHTFHLGTKYSGALGARVLVPSAMIEDSQASPVEPGNMTKVLLQMGCHGIGVSRIIAAVAHHLADERGLNWPRAIAPFEVVVLPGTTTEEEDVATVIRSLTEPSDTFPPIDLALDDRDETFIWKMKDADLVGYPVLVLLGRKWRSDRECEVQCRPLDSIESVPFDRLREHVNGLLARL
ncbi:hypothetical protein F4823DRAFT_630177 [Ustulina deusta]|nr:hypothetical protein F4823DRAFT_630177 [Ustulina deusta]